jgi:hypothetical protein
MMGGSGNGSVPLNKGSGSGGPKTYGSYGSGSGIQNTADKKSPIRRRLVRRKRCKKGGGGTLARGFYWLVGAKQ